MGQASSSWFSKPSQKTVATVQGGAGAAARSSARAKSSKYDEACQKSDTALSNKLAAIDEVNKPGGVNDVYNQKSTQVQNTNDAIKTTENNIKTYNEISKNKLAAATQATNYNATQDAKINVITSEINDLKLDKVKSGADISVIDTEIAFKEKQISYIKADKIDPAEISKLNQESIDALDASTNEQLKLPILENDLKQQKIELAAAEDAKEQSDDAIKELDKKFGDAVLEEDGVREDVADEYPTFKEASDDIDAAIEKEEKALEEKAKEKIKDTTDDAKKAVEDVKKETEDKTQKASNEPSTNSDKQVGSDTVQSNNGESCISASTKPINYNGLVKWDSKVAGEDMPGRVDQLIAQHIQPNYRFSYIGEFPDGKFANLNWMVKSMDRPKVDVEYIEQVRNNVKRFYPIKYNYGDISITFWDNAQHQTIELVYNYFTKHVWKHEHIGSSGLIMLRDSTIIKSMSIWQLSTDGSPNIKHTYENVVLSSYDFDSNEDESDEGVHTIQCVFKFEKYIASVTQEAPAVLSNCSIHWLEIGDKNSPGVSY